MSMSKLGNSNCQ